MKTRGLALALVVMVTMLRSLQACDCYHYYHPQAGFCEGQLAFIFKVTADDYVDSVEGSGGRVIPLRSYLTDGPYPSFRRYTVEKFKLYKETSRLDSTRARHYIYTSYDSCEVALKVGTTYAVVGGYARDDRLYIGSCDQYTDLSNLNRLQRTFLLINWIFRYSDGCRECEIVDCTLLSGEPVRCIERPTNDQCYAVEQRSEGYVDYLLFQTVCIRRKSQCVWVKGFKELGQILKKNDTIY